MARPGPRPAAAALLTTSVLIFLLRSPEVNAGATPTGGQVVTNQFHVVVKRHSDNGETDLRSLADDIATEHGFHNLGPVSRLITKFIFLSLAARLRLRSLLWSTDIRSFRMQGQFSAGPRWDHIYYVGYNQYKVSPLIGSIFFGRGRDFISKSIKLQFVTGTTYLYIEVSCFVM